MDGEEIFLLLSNRRDREPNPELQRESVKVFQRFKGPSANIARTSYGIPKAIVRPPIYDEV